MRTLTQVTLALGLVVAGAALASTPVLAKIKCKNGAQLVGGNWIATPYCQDALLARVAREHGFKVSNHDIRHNPNKKRNICRFVGKDIRVQENCIQSNGADRRGGF
jgi:hypothetical protein